MKVGCGVVMLFIAIGMLWVAFGSAQEASSAGAIDAIVGNKDRAERSAIHFVVGAALFGVVGIVLTASGGSKRPEGATGAPTASTASPAASPQAAAGGQTDARGVSARLERLAELRDRLLISEAEYEERRKAILGEL